MTWLGIDLRWAYMDLLPGIARQTHCMHLAKDVLHDAFVRYAIALHRRPQAGGEAEPVQQPNAYLRRIADSVISDHFRRAQRYVPLPADGDAPDVVQAAEDLADLVPSAEATAEIRQRLELLQRLIENLPPRCREVFWLFRIEGHSQAEIAQRLGISLNMVERHTIRAMLDLRAARDLLGTP